MMRLISLTICLGTFIEGTAQPYKVGDQLPDFTFEHVLNYKSKQANLSQFKGKLVILDMWSTWCTTCIAFFPELERLQKKFDGKVQILLVNADADKHNSEIKIKEALQRLQQKTGYYPRLPIPILDSFLNRYFPHRSVPHEIWISPDGKVIGITRGTAVTEENIKAVLDGGDVKLPLKDDFIFDRNKPFLVEGNGGSPDEFLFRSIITGYKPELPAYRNTRKNELSQITGLGYMNVSLRIFINTAYSRLISSFHGNRIFLDVIDSSRFSFEDEGRQNTFCYDLTIPPLPDDNAALDIIEQYLREDLKRYFKVSVKKERKKMRCLEIRVSDKVRLMTSKYTKEDADYDRNAICKFFHHMRIADIISVLDRFDEPLIDSTGLSDKIIDIDFPSHFNMENRRAVIDFLKKIGFEIKEVEKEMDIIVITDK